LSILNEAIFCALVHRSLNTEVTFVNLCLLAEKMVNPQPGSPSCFSGAC